jgi:hypothetical protein
MSCQTIAACVAGNMMGRNDSVSHAEVVHVIGNLDHFTGDFMAQYKRGSFFAVPLHDIAAADTAGLHPHDDLSRATTGPGYFLDSNVLIVVIHRHTHRFFRKKGAAIMYKLTIKKSRCSFR